MKSISIIRDRGQVTIPDSIRKNVPWANSLSAVSITMTKPDEIVIRPHNYRKEVDWDKLLKQIKRVRTFKGNGNLSSTIAKDRETRR